MRTSPATHVRGAFVQTGGCHQRQRERRDGHGFKSNRREPCVQMPAKMPRSDPRPPCGLPEVPITVRTSRLSCRKVGKAPIFTPVREPSGESSRDRVFKAFCDLVAASMRPGDLFGRLGGEEFACLVANATAQALHTAERLRHEFEAMRFPSLEGNATVSIGVAMASEAGRSLPALLAITGRSTAPRRTGVIASRRRRWSWSTSVLAKPRAGRRNEQPRWRRPRPGRTGYALAASSVTFICVLNCFKFIELCFRLFVTLFGSLAKPRHS